VTTSEPGAVTTTADWAGVRVTELGTTGGDLLAVEGLPDLPLAELRAAWTATLPALFGSPEAPIGDRPGGTVPAGTVPTS
jgi:phosphoribosylformylglycinamidine synthase